MPVSLNLHCYYPKGALECKRGICVLVYCFGAVELFEMTRELLNDAGAVVFLRATSREIHRRSMHYRLSKKGERTRCFNDCFKNTFKNASSLHRLSGTSTGASVQHSTITMKNCRRGKRRLNNAFGGIRISLFLAVTTNVNFPSNSSLCFLRLLSKCNDSHGMFKK